MDNVMLQMIQEPAVVSVYDQDGHPVGRLEPIWPDLWRAVALCGVEDAEDAYAWCWEAYEPRELATVLLLEHLRGCEWSGVDGRATNPSRA